MACILSSLCCSFYTSDTSSPPYEIVLAISHWNIHFRETIQVWGNIEKIVGGKRLFDVSIFTLRQFDCEVTAWCQATAQSVG